MAYWVILTFLCNAGNKQKTIVLAHMCENEEMKPYKKNKLPDLRGWLDQRQLQEEHCAHPAVTTARLVPAFLILRAF